MSDLKIGKRGTGGYNKYPRIKAELRRCAIEEFIENNQGYKGSYLELLNDMKDSGIEVMGDVTKQMMYKYMEKLYQQGRVIKQMGRYYT